ncbi:MAG TPA: WG repeat-containing protein [Methylotenera sp.]|nr:WG repeat-containing protein [Methylotenera sp.]HPH05008.1 WG repeat-containing protein [Methylotenera sp.]HPN00270.1 WG repeat-containing protein [Methylotenera sp.]
MIKHTVLFSIASFPTESDDYYADDGSNIAGLAEWFLTIPDLFLLLLGGDATATPFAVYLEPGTNKALVVETAKAQQRWQVFYKLAVQVYPQLLTPLAHIDKLLMATQHAYLALDVWSSIAEKEQTKKTYNAYLAELKAKAENLEKALSQSTPEHLQAPIAQLLNHWQQSFGYWSTEVIARKNNMDYEPISDNPLLQGLVELEDKNYDDSVDGWLRHIPAYVVRKKGESKESAAVGVVTPYGRWLVPLTLGMNYIHDTSRYSDQNETLYGWLVAAYWDSDLKTHKTIEHNSVLFDVNGVQMTPVLKNTGLFIHSPRVANIIRNYIEHEKYDDSYIVHLPDLSVLVAGTGGVEYSEDGYLHYSQPNYVFYDGETNQRTFAGLMNFDGLVLIPANQYESISEFSKSKKLALVSKFDASRTYTSSLGGEKRLRYGVIDNTGKEIIPCQYLLIGGVHQPKVYQKDRLLALDFNLCPSIYKTNGELVCATPYVVHHAHLIGEIKVVNDCVIVMHEDYMWLMSFDGELVKRDMSVADFQLHLKKMFSGESITYRPITKQDILNADPWDTLYSLSYCLSLGDEATAAAICNSINTYLNKVEDDPEDDPHDSENWSVKEHQSVLAKLVILVFEEVRSRGFARHVDWKDTDAISDLADWIDALDGFEWNANDNGESINEGIAAAGRYAQKNGVHLFLFAPEDDSYKICFVRDVDKTTLLEITASLGVTIQPA